MKKLVSITVLCLLACSVNGQDLGWLIEQAPTVCRIVSDALTNAPAFTAAVEVHVTGKDPKEASLARGTLESRSGNIRWDVKLEDVKSAQLGDAAKAAVRQLNGERVTLLTRPDQRANYILLPGAHAYLEQVLPLLKATRTEADTATEALAGHLCLRQRLKAVSREGKALEVILWKARASKELPLQLQVTDADETIQVRFNPTSFQTPASGRFQLPGGLTKYSSLEDLIQSVLVTKMKKRMGLQ